MKRVETCLLDVQFKVIIKVCPLPFSRRSEIHRNQTPICRADRISKDRCFYTNLLLGTAIDVGLDSKIFGKGHVSIPVKDSFHLSDRITRNDLHIESAKSAFAISGAATKGIIRPQPFPIHYEIYICVLICNGSADGCRPARKGS